MSVARGPRTRHPGAPRRTPWGVVRATLAVVAVGGAFAGIVLGGDSNASGATGAPARKWTWNLPANLPVPVVPKDNPMTAAKVALGRYLFYDTRLSGNGTQSCGTCHLQSKAFTDGLPVAIGSTGQHTPRGTQPLANVAYNPTLTWANPALVRLEKQMEIPLFGERPVEMGVTDRNSPVVLRRIRTDRRYRVMFRTAFPRQAQPVAWGNIIKAISAFQRTLISGNSKYDRYLRGAATLTAAETRGKDLFFGEKAECHHCHGSFNLNDQVNYVGAGEVQTAFHNTGLYNIGGVGAYPEQARGVFDVTGAASDMGKFRAPSLRNIALTAPYMHDGSIATLPEVVATYAAGGRNITDGPNAGDGRANPYKSPLLTVISLTPEEQADIVAFLNTLTDRGFVTNPRFSNPFTR